MHRPLTRSLSGFRPDDKTRSHPLSRFPIRPETKTPGRFRLIAPDELLSEFTVDDPLLYTKVWRAEYSMVRSAPPILEFACHESNYGLRNILSGARCEEMANGTPAAE